MWIAIFSDGTEHDTGVDDIDDDALATEDADGWCRDTGMEQRYELVWRE